VPAMMRGLKRVGVPFDEAVIAKADEDVAGKTKMDALIAFLQSLKLPHPPQADAAPTAAPAAATKTESAP